MSVKIEGMDKAIAAINQRLTSVNNVAPKTIEEITLDLLGKSKPRAPVDTGDLRGSGFAELNGTVGIVGYTEPYALRQHEELNYNHPKGGEAKYLENPLKENLPRYIQKIADDVKKAVE